MGIGIFIAILVIHWFADFVLQSDAQAKGKSEDWIALLSHTAMYSFTWFVSLLWMVGAGMIPITGLILFTVVTFIAHTLTDYFTSRINKYYWEKGNTHNFFVSVGFDQILHYIQLILTLKLLFI